MHQPLECAFELPAVVGRLVIIVWRDKDCDAGLFGRCEQGLDIHHHWCLHYFVHGFLFEHPSHFEPVKKRCGRPGRDSLWHGPGRPPRGQLLGLVAGTLANGVHGFLGV